MASFKKGDLVEPTKMVTAAYSGYGLNPKMNFEPGMLGVVRHIDESGVQVEFFHPATGCIESVRTKLLNKVKWPEKQTLPPDTERTEKGWWFCGSLNWKGALELLRVSSEIRPDYFCDLTPETLRIPGIHGKRIRRIIADPPIIDFCPSRAEIALRKIAEWVQCINHRRPKLAKAA